MTTKAATKRQPSVRGRSRLPSRTRLDFWLDLALLVAFSLDYSFRFTGLAIHEWIGIGFGAALLLHLTLHWEWVLRTTSRILTPLPARDRVRWVVDLGLLVVMSLCVASGVLVSRSALPFLGIKPVSGAFWNGLHTTTADLTIFLVAVHVALSWRWVLSVGKRVFGRSTRGVTA